MLEGFGLKQEKLEDYSLLKVMATVLVVFAHITGMYTDEGVLAPLNQSPFFDYITKLIYSYHMPLFIFVSGAIYSYLRNKKGKYSDIKAFAENKAKRLMWPYLVFGIAYVTPVMVGLGFTDENAWMYMLKGIILSENPRHLWYLFGLFNIFIVFRLSEDHIKTLPDSVKLLCLLMLYLVSPHIPMAFQLKSISRYLIYFYMGYAFQESKGLCLSILKPSLKTLMLSLSINIGLIQYAAAYAVKGQALQIIVLLEALTGILAIYSFAALLLKTNILENKAYKRLEKNSFGIYLFHPMIIYGLFYCWAHLDVPPLLLILVIFCITMYLSDLLTEGMRRLNWQKLIGE